MMTVKQADAHDKAWRLRHEMTSRGKVANGGCAHCERAVNAGEVRTITYTDTLTGQVVTEHWQSAPQGVTRGRVWSWYEPTSMRMRYYCDVCLSRDEDVKPAKTALTARAASDVTAHGKRTTGTVRANMSAAHMARVRAALEAALTARWT